MAFYVVYFIICVFASSYTGTVAEFHDPMVLVYYPPKLNIYALSDLDTVFSTISAKYAKIIFLCPSEGEIRGRKEAVFKVKRIISSDSVAEIVKEDEQCETSSPDLELRPSIYAPFELKPDFHKVTYIISNDEDTKNLLESNELSDTQFPSIDFYSRKDFYEIYGFWIITFDATQLAARLTLHHIVDYNMAKGEQKLQTCEHSFFDIDGLEKDNILRKFIEQGKFEFKSGENVLVPHQLVPIDDFTDYYSRLATCTYMNIVPVWQPISEGPLRRIERYIQRLVTKLPVNTISVSTAAYGVLDSPYSWNFLFKPKLFMDGDKKIVPVPQLLLKIILYRIPSPPSKFPNSREFHDDRGCNSVVIVIHNEMKKNGIEKVCNTDDEKFCENNGWNVTSGDDKYGNIYCCGLDDNFFAGLPIRRSSQGVFNLKAVQFEGEGQLVNVAKQLENERSQRSDT